MSIIQTAERVSQNDASDNFVFQRSILAYVKAAELVSGNVLEIGTGSGYGIEIIAKQADKYTTVDKFISEPAAKLLENNINNVEFVQMNVPPLKDIPDNSLDFVISFQVIEHIKNDDKFVSEIHRVLKKKGKFIVSTPNIKMSLTRNPWHIREYTVTEFETLLAKNFGDIEKLGVFGNEKIMEYYNKNKESVKKITRFDIFNLQYRLPRQVLQIPYDILNRINRKKLLNQNSSLVTNITMEDYFLDTANDNCFDLFYVAQKG
jgi:ubiquinone/menaquinone biosynthesis C-methylase UbiE